MDDQERKVLEEVKRTFDAALSGRLGSWYPDLLKVEDLVKRTLPEVDPKRVVFRMDSEVEGLIHPGNFHTAVVLFYVQMGIPILGMGQVGESSHVVEGVGTLTWDSAKQELLFAPVKPVESLEVTFVIGREGVISS